MTYVTAQTEERPASYPVVAGLSMEAAALDPEFLWRRIESYIAHRFSPRAVTWMIDVSPAEFRWPLYPVSIGAVYGLSSDYETWKEIAQPATGRGLEAGSARFLRVEATVGHALTVPLPGDVAEAFRRLAEYVAAPDAIGIPGASRYNIDLGRISETISRREDHMARALINSGAADLLRPYRRT